MLTTVAQLTAMAFILHGQLVHDERLATEMAQNLSINVWVVDQLPKPRHSGGAGYVGDYDALCYRSIETPPAFRFLPSTIQKYCFTRITSMSFRKPFPNAAVFDHIFGFSALQSAYLPGTEITVEIKERFRAKFPYARLSNTEYSRWGAIGAPAIRNSGEPSDAPKDRASRFDSGNSPAGPR